jgi:hypothetical protein
MANLTKKNLFEYANNAYKKDFFCHSIREVKNDLALIDVIKRWFIKMNDTYNSKQYRKLLNLFIRIHNVFDRNAIVRISFFKTLPEHHHLLKSALLLFGDLPDYLIHINGETISIVELPIDIKFQERLKNGII